MTEHEITPSSTETFLITDGPDPGHYRVGTYIKGKPAAVGLSAAELHALARWITNTIPKPDTLDTARFVRGQDVNCTPRTLAKFDGHWYDEHGNQLTADSVRQSYDFIEGII